MFWEKKIQGIHFKSLKNFIIEFIYLFTIYCHFCFFIWFNDSFLFQCIHLIYLHLTLKKKHLPESQVYRKRLFLTTAVCYRVNSVRISYWSSHTVYLSNTDLKKLLYLHRRLNREKVSLLGAFDAYLIQARVQRLMLLWSARCYSNIKALFLCNFTDVCAVRVRRISLQSNVSLFSQSVSYLLFHNEMRSCEAFFSPLHKCTQSLKLTWRLLQHTVSLTETT